MTIPHRLFIEFNPVRNTTCHESNVDEVEMIFRVCPILDKIVDFEFAVGWKKVWLDRREVDANNFCGWILICEIADVPLG